MDRDNCHMSSHWGSPREQVIYLIIIFNFLCSIRLWKKILQFLHWDYYIFKNHAGPGNLGMLFALLYFCPACHICHISVERIFNWICCWKIIFSPQDIAISFFFFFWTQSRHLQNHLETRRSRYFVTRLFPNDHNIIKLVFLHTLHNLQSVGAPIKHPWS